tara:strand:- start:14697 stop:15698 length:1002 start_codon:yes stop_codon:yes gene_type:complete
MKKLPTVLDHYDDGGLLLRKEFAERGIPHIVKVAADLSASINTHADDYALVVDTPQGKAYKLPIIDAGNTIASALYFSEHGGDLPENLQKEAAQKLSAALTSFGFTPPEDITKTAAMELGYSGEAEDRSLESLFGVTKDDDQWEVVSDAFESCSPRGKRRLMLQVKEAGAFNGLFTEDMADYARAELGSDFAMGLDTRKLAVLEGDGIAELEALMVKSASADPDQLAEDLADFDIRNNITHLYNKVIPDPYQTVFGTSVEKNASAPQSLEIGGREYASNDIVSWVENGGSENLTSSFGEDFTSEFTSDPVAVLGSLPSTHKQAIARMIDDHTR